MRILKAGILWCLAVIGALFLAFGARKHERPPEGRVLVQYWEKWTGAEAEQMRQIVTDFNDTVGREKNIYVQYLSMSSINEKMLLATAAGVPPDVAGIWDTNVPQYSVMDVFEPLEEMAAARGITEAYYKPVYWRALHTNGHLWGLISTPMATALDFNKQIFLDNADALRKAGLDPEHVPETIEELDRYSVALDLRDASGRLVRSGHLPMQPGWYLVYTTYWFGGRIFDEKTGRFTFADENGIRAYEWIGSYSKRLGRDAISDFRSAFGQFSSPQNPFMAGSVAMEQQGPWMQNFIDVYAPSMTHWNVPRALWQREKDFAARRKSLVGMTREQVEQIFGSPEEVQAEGQLVYDAGLKTLRFEFREGKVSACEAKFKPAMERRKMTQWGAVVFPSVSRELRDVAHCGGDVLVIPKGAKHKAEAFEFIAYVNRQEVMEKLCMLHCKNSPLAQVSEDFLTYHPNPYIAEYERMANSPNAFGVPPVPIWTEVVQEMTAAADKVALGKQDARTALTDAQTKMQGRYDEFMARQRARRAQAGADGGRP